MIYLKTLEEKPIALAFALNVSPKTFKRYVDNHSCTRFENKQKFPKFLQILNKQGLFIKYTAEFENDQKQLNFLDIHSVHWGINPPSKTSLPFFLPSPHLKSANFPSPPF